MITPENYHWDIPAMAEVLGIIFFLLAVGVVGGWWLHKLWHEPKTNIYDIWSCIGAKERSGFAVNLCKSHGSLLCGIMKNIGKCKGGK